MTSRRKRLGRKKSKRDHLKEVIALSKPGMPRAKLNHLLAARGKSQNAINRANDAARRKRINKRDLLDHWSSYDPKRHERLGHWRAN